MSEDVEIHCDECEKLIPCWKDIGFYMSDKVSSALLCQECAEEMSEE